MKNKVILRCSTDGVVNIPKETFKGLGWKLNEPVEVCLMQTPYVDENDKVLTINQICIQRVKDVPMLDETTDDHKEWKRHLNLIFESLEDEK